MRSIKCILLALWLLPAVVFSQEKVIVNDENAQRRDVGRFREISVSGSINLYLSPGDEEVVVVSARTPDLRDKIVTRIKGERLEIFFDGRRSWPTQDKDLKAYVSFRQLSQILGTGASDIFVNGVVRAEALNIHLSGASDFQGAVDAGRLEINQSGSSDSRVSGRAGSANVHLSGASDMKAFELSVDMLDAHASGASKIEMTVNKELSISASGASDVRFKGSGIVKEVKTSGASSVRNQQ